MFSQQRNKEDCQKNCQETSGCNFWTFVSRRERSGLARSCFLYSSKTTQVQSRRRTSGPKFCSSQPPATSRPPVSSMGSNSPLPYHAHHFLTPMHNATNKPAKENFMVAFALYLLYSHFNTAQSAVKYDHAAFLLINYQTLLNS